MNAKVFLAFTNAKDINAKDIRKQEDTLGVRVQIRIVRVVSVISICRATSQPLDPNPVGIRTVQEKLPR